MYNAPFGKFFGYTYENMENDIAVFRRIFNGILRTKSLGKTADNRNIYHFAIGDKEAEAKLLLFGAIHGREYMTAQLLMEQTAEFLSRLLKGGEGRAGDSLRELLKGKEIQVVPMANPDGVTISQFGVKGIRNRRLREAIWEIAGEEGGRLPCGPYFSRWKANARGVDLNRNFSANWEQYEGGAKIPASENYKGSEPECEEESRALARLTREEGFCRTISYHSSGAVIYWNFELEGELYKRTKKFAEEIAAVTGYETDGDYQSLSPAGYKDWALKERKIPSLTIEVGRAASPLPAHCFREILRENRGVWEAALYGIQKEGENP